MKWKESVYLISIFIISLQYNNKLCGPGGGLHVQIIGIEQRTHTDLLKRLLTKMKKQFNGGKIVFSTNGSRVIGHEKMNLNPILTLDTKAQN